ncbi:hypothetical protein PsorP6_016401 [Peronosclerospora sorghi]|uniref:Uncharacterized protein n=1 Tax=Peronosclerospora sorghi TaxID=230839 RepID=A0ACC0VRB2_9STRA|nr:hypothetical protein PsorP6_016401 [Peronosclerospora sorghi]
MRVTYASVRNSVRLGERDKEEEVALQDRGEMQLDQEDEQQMQIREERVAEREVEVQALKKKDATDVSQVH